MKSLERFFVFAFLVGVLFLFKNPSWVVAGDGGTCWLNNPCDTGTLVNNCEAGYTAAVNYWSYNPSNCRCRGTAMTCHPEAEGDGPKECECRDYGVSRVCAGRYFGKPQCESRNLNRTGGSCQLNPKLGTILPNNPNYWKWSWCTTGSVTPTLTPVPRVTPTSTPRPAPTQLPVENNCSGQYFGKSQCQARTANLTGGSCQLNPKLGEIVPGGMNYWRWSWCKN